MQTGVNVVDLLEKFKVVEEKEQLSGLPLPPLIYGAVVNAVLL